MTIVKPNAVIRYLCKVNHARRFALEFGITNVGIDVDHRNVDPRYVEAYLSAARGDLILITDRVKDLWLKPGADTRELAKLLRVIKVALEYERKIYKE